MKSKAETPLQLVLADGSQAQAVAWRVDGKFDKGKDLSGIACGPDGLGLVATDEGSLLQSFRLDRAERTLRVGAARAALLRPGEEADYEGLCWDEGWFYAVGSHARGRKRPDHQPSRHHVYRVRLGGSGVDAVEISHALGPLLGADPVLGAHYHRRLDQDKRGIDVEGVAVRADTVLLGLRSPCCDGTAFMLEVALPDLFDLDPEREPKVLRHALALGQAAGIRDLALVPDGLLLLTGPSVDGDHAPFALWHRGAAGLRPLGRFAELGEAKAEGLLVLAAADGYQVLVVFDGVAQGRPHEYWLPRPA